MSSEINNDENNDNSLLLLAQNNSLQLELIKYKRSIQSTRQELSLLRQRSSSMEHIVSILQRLWSQLEIDTSMLLDEMGDICSDNNNKTTASNNNIISLPLIKFQNAGNNYREIDPTKIDIPDLNIDIWSSTDIVINECKEAKDKIISLYNDQSKNIEFTTKLNDKFLTHATFIQSLIERLCFAINITGMFEQVPDVLEVLSLAKELNAERFSLTDKVIKLSNSIIELNSKKQLYEIRKNSIEKLLQSNGKDEDSSNSQNAIKNESPSLITFDADTGIIYYNSFIFLFSYDTYLLLLNY
jgi:hypothetical protein